MHVTAPLNSTEEGGKSSEYEYRDYLAVHRRYHSRHYANRISADYKDESKERSQAVHRAGKSRTVQQRAI